MKPVQACVSAFPPQSPPAHFLLWLGQVGSFIDSQRTAENCSAQRSRSKLTAGKEGEKAPYSEMTDSLVACLRDSRDKSNSSLYALVAVVSDLGSNSPLTWERQGS